MKSKADRIAVLKNLISTRELGSQEEVLKALAGEGFPLHQTTLSRDMKQLKVVKAARPDGKYIYVLPTETLYKRIRRVSQHAGTLSPNGFKNIRFSGNMGVIHTNPGYASSIAYNIDTADLDCILGTIAGDDTIFIVVKQDISYDEVIDSLSEVIPNISDNIE